ncbi:MAG: HipA family kinase [Solirubrobacteraceae bacterium]
MAGNPLRSVTATRYVTPLREGGSLPGLVEADDDGLYVAKFRGAGQGARALIAEVVAGELARALGLRIPELVTLDVDQRLAAAEPDPEIQDLIVASVGSNLGVDFLPGSLSYAPGGPWAPTPELAAEIVWFDALTTNVDRSPRNPNLLVWHERLWLIDHGAALYLQHEGLARADPQRPFAMIADHVLLPLAGSILEAHERMSERLTPGMIEEAVALVPSGWFAADGPEHYVRYLTIRSRGDFAQEAERARLG